MAALPVPLFRVFMPETAHAALAPVLSSGRLATGPKVAEFEHQFAAWLSVPRVVAISDASAALTLALFLAGVRPGDEVITSPLACAATLMPIANLFAKPVWGDVDPHTGMLDAANIAGLITEKTRAILLYHWSGNVGDLAGIAAIARLRGIKLVHDASEALGATYHGRHLGAEADFTVYSFYATKHINCGDGAALLAKDADDLQRAVQLRRFGIDHSQLRLANGDLNPAADIPVAGYNFPMNEIAATLAGEALPHARRIVERHRENGAFYDASLAGIPGVQQVTYQPNTQSAYWTYTLLAERRDALLAKLLTHGVGAQRLHLRLDGYRCFGGEMADLPGVSAFDAQNLSIPCGWWVDDAAREYVLNCIRTGW